MDNTSKDSLEQLNKDILVSIADDCMTAYICLKIRERKSVMVMKMLKSTGRCRCKMGINDELIHRILSEKDITVWKQWQKENMLKTVKMQDINYF